MADTSLSSFACDSIWAACRYGVLLLTACISVLSSQSRAVEHSAVAAISIEREQLLAAIAREQKAAPIDTRVTGISVPHHLLASDLIARAFRAAAGNRYERVVILSPDHYNRSRRPFATTQRDFETAFGVVPNDRAASSTLLAESALFEESDLFDQEHGITAIVPFVKHFLLNAKIVPIAISGSSTRHDWDQAVALLANQLGSDVLIVQSTDYSHFLPQSTAVHRDQETLNLISANDVDAITRLIQVPHLDSKAAQYIQMRLQSDVLKSQGVVVASRNSVAYGANANKTTSYIVTIYTEKPSAGSQLKYNDQHILYFGGDVFIGRLFTAALANSAVAKAITAEVHKLTAGAPLIINLEGVVLDDPPEKLPRDVLVSHASLAIPILKALNVSAASLANNHSLDVGPAGYSETQSILERSGIAVLHFNEIVDVGPVRVLALNFIPNKAQNNRVFSSDDLTQLCRTNARPPLVAFVHWGNEFTDKADTLEYSAADALQTCGVSAVVGTHSHRASAQIEARQGGEFQMTYSLGNLLFDQRSGRSSGALLELRVFEQGTYATRLVPIVNLYEFGTALLDTHAKPTPNRIRPNPDHTYYGGPGSFDLR
jgi:AmmeMemoRadiSam system protein B